MHEAGLDAGVEAAGPGSEAATATFVGRWQRLVSQTNWEKGRIIAEWRDALQASGAAAGDFSDEVWAQQVGHVSGQHVGRLRRVWQRFGAVHEQFEGLYWSHFQAALEWHDAEMWLEGGLQNDWSVARMREARAAALGGEGEAALEQVTAAADFDEDAEQSDGGPAVAESATQAVHWDREPPFDASPADEANTALGEANPPLAHADDDEADDAPPAIAPFAGLSALPDDLADAFDAFKLAIVRHKRAGWEAVSASEVVRALRALEQFALTPGEE